MCAALWAVFDILSFDVIVPASFHLSAGLFISSSLYFETASSGAATSMIGIAGEHMHEHAEELTITDKS